MPYVYSASVNTASDYGSSLRSLWARHAATGVVRETSPRSQPQSNNLCPEIVIPHFTGFLICEFYRKLGWLYPLKPYRPGCDLTQVLSQN